MTSAMELIGRSSSHYTRVVRMVALETGVELRLVPVHDITALEAQGFAGNPALKIPTLRRPDGGLVFGAENICRVIAGDRLAWPEQRTSDLQRNAQELVEHAMAAQVQLVIGTVVGKLPADHPYFAKIRAGYEGALDWLEAHAPLRPEPGLMEIELFCLLEHIVFRGPLTLDRWPRLAAFARELGQRPSAQATPYRFDAP